MLTCVVCMLLMFVSHHVPAADAGHSNLQVLILPGNPGSAGYYEAYIASLHAALHGRADIHAVSHLGHASSREARLSRTQVMHLYLADCAK